MKLSKAQRSSQYRPHAQPIHFPQSVQESLLNPISRLFTLCKTLMYSSVPRGVGQAEQMGLRLDSQTQCERIIQAVSI